MNRSEVGRISAAIGVYKVDFARNERESRIVLLLSLYFNTVDYQNNSKAKIHND